MAEYVEKTWLESHTCGVCGVLFAAPMQFWAARKKDRQSWYCPNGHCRVFSGPSEADKLKSELERKDQMLTAAQARAATSEQNLAQVTRAHRKMRERVMNGVCPCCNRSFSNLRQHMKTEHADFGNVRTLFALRQAFGMSQAAVAREAGVDPMHVSLYERDKRLTDYAKDALDRWLERHEASKTVDATPTGSNHE